MPTTKKKPAPRFIRLDEAGKPVSTRAKHHAQVKDTTTGLIWCAASIKVDNWKAGEDACKAFRLGGHKTWRMPTVKELISIVDYEKRNPAIDTRAFPDTPSEWFWSSSPVVGWPELAWGVAFYDGRVHGGPRDYGGFVRPVRVARPRQ